jgi:hypothetical protein
MACEMEDRERRVSKSYNQFNPFRREKHADGGLDAVSDGRSCTQSRR